MPKKRKSSPKRLAGEFLDLWQEQLSTMLTEPKALEWWLGMANAVSRATAARSTNRNPSSFHATNGASAEPRSDASDGAYGRLIVELAFRLGECEKRIAALESALAQARAGDGERPAAH